ncbi:hypothetical protein V1517DRAFT_328384 [Lipomyces orientalis]|uniref:Uncharacterized protein n=1 Tax=Lipomyces orientalis TaxID=1233043 RepID=A0ACC3THS4_9ASCO
MSVLFKPLSVPGLEDTLMFGFPLSDLLHDPIKHTSTATATTSDIETLQVSSSEGGNARITENLFAIAACAVKSVATSVVGGLVRQTVHAQSTDVFVYNPVGRDAVFTDSTHYGSAKNSIRADGDKSKALVLYSGCWDIVTYKQYHAFQQPYMPPPCVAPSQAIPQKALWQAQSVQSDPSSPIILQCMMSHNFWASTLTFFCSLKFDDCHRVLLRPTMSSFCAESAGRLPRLENTQKAALGTRNSDINDKGHGSQQLIATVENNYCWDVIVYQSFLNPWVGHDNHKLTATTGTDVLPNCPRTAAARFVQLSLDPANDAASRDAERLNPSFMQKSRHNYFHRAAPDFKYRASTSIRPTRVPFLPLDPNQIRPHPSPILKLSEHLQHADPTECLLPSGPVTPDTETDFDTIFDIFENSSDTSPLDSPSWEPYSVDYFDIDNELDQSTMRLRHLREQRGNINVELIPEGRPVVKRLDEIFGVQHSLLTPPFPPRNTADIDILSNEANINVGLQNEGENIAETSSTDISASIRRRSHSCSPREGEEIPEGVTAIQIYAEVSGFMFRHLDTSPGLRQVFASRDHRKGTKHMKAEIKLMYDTITRHRSLGIDEQNIVDLVVRAVYSWRAVDRELLTAEGEL